MPILCNCCNCDNAPMARHRDYWICDDCVERYGSYDAAVEHILNKRYADKSGAQFADNSTTPEQTLDYGA